MKKQNDKIKWEHYTKRQPASSSVVVQITMSAAFDNAEYKFGCGSVILVLLDHVKVGHLGMRWGGLQKIGF